MQYIHTYATQNDYDLDDGKGYPNVGYVEGDDVVIYHMEEPTIDWSKEYLTFEAVDDCQFKLHRAGSAVASQYSLDNGVTWENISDDTYSPTVLAGQKIKWKGNIKPRESETDGAGGVGVFSSTGRFNAMGNPYCMFSGDSFTEVTTLARYALNQLFHNANIISAKNLSLPCDTLSEKCYRMMFRNTPIVEPPELPATSLATYCYNSMFHTCSALTASPVLPATTLIGNCYEGMFRNCSAMKNITYMASVAPTPTYTYNWAAGLPSEGTFIRSANATWAYSYGGNNIPSGWTVINATP